MAMLQKVTPYKPEQKRERAELFTEFDVYKSQLISYQEIEQGYDKMDRQLGFIVNYAAVLHRAFRVAKLHYRKHNEEVTDDALTRPEFRIFLYYINYYYNMYNIYKNDKKPKINTQVRENFLPTFRKYLEQ